MYFLLHDIHLTALVTLLSREKRVYPDVSLEMYRHKAETGCFSNTTDKLQTQWRAQTF